MIAHVQQECFSGEKLELYEPGKAFFIPGTMGVELHPPSLFRKERKLYFCHSEKDRFIFTGISIKCHKEVP